VLKAKGALDAADVNAARKAGDELATEIWDSTLYHLALACVSLQRLLDTDLIVLAGGLTKAGDDLMIPLQKYYSELDWKLTPQMSKLVIAELGSDAGVIGAAGVAWEAFGETPQ
jgi:glucokinase